ncbi:MAG: hypothetical protein OXC80_15070 [Gammaproteobacteria bacterium]|nr:hypothetical protein [Gammaproteobacteria bacterium]
MKNTLRWLRLPTTTVGSAGGVFQDSTQGRKVLRQDELAACVARKRDLPDNQALTVLIQLNPDRSAHHKRRHP